MIQHLLRSDPVTAEGLAHLEQCASCQCVLAYDEYTDAVLGKEPTMPLPNINRVEPHWWCTTLRHDETFRSRVGDVRVCKHGKVQVRTETYSQRIAGPGTDWWRDLHPLFTPLLWRRAKAALGQARG